MDKQKGKTCTRCKAEYEDVDKYFSKNGKSAAGNIVYRSSCKFCEVKRVMKQRAKGNAKGNIEAEYRRVAKGNKLFEAIPQPILCSVCSKPFIVAVLPAERSLLQITCEDCVNKIAAQQQKTEGV